MYIKHMASIFRQHIDGLLQDCSTSHVLAMEWVAAVLHQAIDKIQS